MSFREAFFWDGETLVELLILPCATPPPPRSAA